MDSVWGGGQCRLHTCQEEAEARRPPVLILVQMVCDEGDLEEEGGIRSCGWGSASLQGSETCLTLPYLRTVRCWQAGNQKTVLAVPMRSVKDSLVQDRPGGTHVFCESSQSHCLRCMQLAVDLVTASGTDPGTSPHLSAMLTVSLQKL